MLIQDTFRVLLDTLGKIIDGISVYQNIEKMILTLENDDIDPTMLW